MAQEKDDPKKPSGEAVDRNKRPTTIDLKATEIRPEPAPKSEQSKTEQSKTGQPAPASQRPESAAGSVPKVAPRTEPDKNAKPAFESAAGSDPKGTDKGAKGASGETGGTGGPTPPRGGNGGSGGNGGAQAPSSKGSIWPLIGVAAAAAIVFFVIGLGAAQWLSGRMSLAPESAPAPVVAQPSPELLTRIDRIETQLGAVRKDDPQLQARLAKIESALNVPPKDDSQLLARLAKVEAQLGAPRPNDQQLLARIAAAEAAVKTLADMTAAREKRSDDIAALAHEARDRASTAVTAAEAAQKSPPPESRADLEAMTARLAELEQAARNNQAELARRQSADDAKGRFAIATIALRDAVDSGLPFEAELAAVKALSGDSKAVAALEPFAATGVPSAASLGRELAALMPAIWKIARKDEVQEGTFLERLQANASKIVRIRPAGEVAGDDPASVSSRIESRAGRADIRGALAELAKLPADARAPAEGWIKKAQASNAAIAAARSISQSALGALAKSGS